MLSVIPMLTVHASWTADANPFSFMLDMSSEASRFDPSGNYVRRWMPALSRLPTKYIHRCDNLLSPSTTLPPSTHTFPFIFPSTCRFDRMLDTCQPRWGITYLHLQGCTGVIVCVHCVEKV